MSDASRALALADLSRVASMLCIRAAPTLGFGLNEDFGRYVSPRRRVLATALLGLLGALLLPVIPVRTGWNWFDSLFVYPLVVRWASSPGTAHADSSLSATAAPICRIATELGLMRLCRTSASVVPAAIWRNNTPMLLVTIIVFVAACLRLY